MIIAKLAFYYGWSEEDIRRKMLSRVVQFTTAIDILLTEENKRLIDFQLISSAQIKDDYKQKLYEYYAGKQEQILDGRAMAAKYARHVRKKGQPWPKGKD